VHVNVRASCEGPIGPHLFRASTSSTDYSNLHHVLQMSPIQPDYLRSPDSYYKGSQGIDSAFDNMDTPTTTITEEPYTIPPMGWGWQSEDPTSWTAVQVSIWMQESHMESDIIGLFAENDISGDILLNLEFADLKELGIQSFGKRHQVWNHICTLRDNHGHIPKGNAFDAEDSGKRNSSHSKHSQNSCETPLVSGPRRRAKLSNTLNPITPADSVSIVAIEQLLPKPHRCAKGDNCSKFKKQQRILQNLHKEHNFPISPENGGRIFMAGNPGNAATAYNVAENVHHVHPLANEYRPVSDAAPSVVGPSVVASSDLLGPGDYPSTSLDPEALDRIAQRDPQDNVMSFLALQRIDPPIYLPPPFDEAAGEDPNVQPELRPVGNVAPLPILRSLPRLQIPGSTNNSSILPFHHPGDPTSAGPTMSAVDNYFSPYHTAFEQGIPVVPRFGTPASEMDVPVTQPALGPVSRDASQSVPPNMQFREPVERSMSRVQDWRRPSFQLPPLEEEGTVISSTIQSTADYRHQPTPSASSAPSDTVGSPTVSSGPSMQAPSSKTSLDVQDSLYRNVTHTGWMKKRKTKLLRHEWHEHHFRLNKQAQLTMHRNDLPASSPMDTLNIDEYAVACSSIASNKLSAKFKALKIQSAASKEAAEAAKDAAFSFQLVPTRGEGDKMKKALESKKTHHFAVKTRDDRIDWMRELMLAKALREKAENGYEVEVMRGGSAAAQHNE
jgi:hypothetical protein